MNNRVFFTGGGTGGHVYPALAVIDKLNKSKDWDIRWLGSSKGMERDIIKQTRIPYIGMPSGKLRRYFSIQNFLDLFRITAGVIKAFFYLMFHRPRLLFSKGGFVSVPPVLAAWLLRIPVYSHESDLDPGLATKINSRFSKKIFLPYEESLSYFSSKLRSKLVVSGNPLREALFQGDKTKLQTKWSIPADKKVLLVLGGSSGAKQINDIIDEIKAQLLDLGLYIIHQRGKGHLVAEANPNPHYKAVEYFHDDMADVYDIADIVVSRAGANSLWELCSLGKATILIPLDSGSRGDQVRNAELFENKGALWVLESKTASGDKLLPKVKELTEDDNKRLSLGQRASEVFSGGASQLLADEIIKELQS
ncbi:undecaprenyldiphospho-muramoylpentapeptide beta-N-acetylglucosaminyltransferase [Spirochaeta cellobiosiphila]|uniref:undecaprenyldiphospho-muramoylpentapeptide beta-N-acetylglucosaminyltransferase n=1 Tax=Spirochaeta cellobiosiphila TaxID=504483 RepID=UPI000400E31F|nr:undecaprenyldiphospho-muramoylpentapeptide beta-N-acetylglucosaminyltransferase [Spirochaeta cellobiosiphila]